MSREKQIEEVRKDIFAAFGGYAKWEEDWQSLAEAVYNAGYRKQSEPFSWGHENGSKWISVEERLPDNHRIVLVACESTTVSAGVLMAIGSYGGGFWSLGGTDGTLYLTKYMQFVVSHWMELPEMPKKGGE